MNARHNSPTSNAEKIAAIERDRIVERLCQAREQIAMEKGFWIGVAVTVLIVTMVMIGRAAHVSTKHVRMEEHRAPTDESIRLVREMEEKAMERERVLQTAEKIIYEPY